MRKRKQWGMVLMVFGLGFISQAKVHLESQNGVFSNLSIYSSHLASPFEIPGGKDGGIYFQLDQEKKYLESEPFSVSEKEDAWSGQWTVDGRVVTISIRSDGPHYRVSLTADKSDDIQGWGISVKADAQEYFTGLTERVVDDENQRLNWKKGITEAMNMRGQQVEMKVKHTLGLYSPFFLSSRGYGLFTHGTWIGHYRFPEAGKDGRVEISFEGPSLAMTLYTGGPAKVVSDHMMATGPQLLPPKWSLRPYRWRDDHFHRDTYYDGSPVNAPYNSEVVEDILMMDALGIPCGIYWVDRPWGLGEFGYDDLEYDPQRLPNTREMITWLADRDIRLMLWICPWAVGPNMEKEGYDNGYVIDTPNAKFPGGQRRNCIDFTNPQAVKWWQSYLKKVLDDGVVGFKMDRAEERSRELYKTNQTVHDGRTGREVYNDYSRLYVKAASEICREVHGDEFVIFPRAGYAGSARYSCFWGGDSYGDQWGLRSAIIGGLKSSLIGFPVWGSDTGGYQYYEKGKKSFRPKTGCRWLAFSCFCPIMQVGPTANKGPWDIDETLTAVWRMYARIHDDLLEYSYRHVKQTHETGMPVMRPLFLMYPDQPQAWENWQTYLYGADILVAPIWQEDDVVSQRVYLPAGERWIDAWDPATVLDGGQTVTVECPLHKIPIFIRQGSKVDLGDLNKRWAESVEVVKNKPTMAELEEKAGFIKKAVD
jgi:alpha-D-xyloside xylohydrolase